MLKTQSQLDYENVVGYTFMEADRAMRQIEFSLTQREGIGFNSKEECTAYAKEIHADTLVYQHHSSSILNVNHLGETLRGEDWGGFYEDVLFWTEEKADKNGVIIPKQIRYDPRRGHASRSKARCYGEIHNGIRDPLYHKNYFTPKGFYDEVKGTFNIARPIATYARNSGADTSAVHELLRHISGECYPHVLSWLRQKMVNPSAKTEVVPIFVGHQGTGKSTFGEVICTALFGEENVLVTDQFDSTARFNADNADALIISIEEKMQEDKRNTSSSLKSRATAKKVRKENKGVDPIFQESHTDFVLTTNELVPLKFEDRGNQRRFMVMEVDANYTREQSEQADKVFTKLYGYDGKGVKQGPGFIHDKDMIEQFKQELWDKKGFEGINYKEFPKTDAYRRCFDIPRTNEVVYIESIAKSLVPFIIATLTERKVTPILQSVEGENVFLDRICDENALQFIGLKKNNPDRIALCRPLIFMDDNGKPYAHSVIERTLIDLRAWFKEQGLTLLSDTKCPHNGFKDLSGRHKYAPTTWFSLTEKLEEIEENEEKQEVKEKEVLPEDSIVQTITHEALSDEEVHVKGNRVRYNSFYQYDAEGEFETLNPLYSGCIDRKEENTISKNVFLLEADDTTSFIREKEEKYVNDKRRRNAEYLSAEVLYADRLKIQDQEAERLFNEGIACRIVYSGAKSLHILVQVEDAPDTKEERDWLDAYLKSTLSTKLSFDQSTKDAARLTRAPITRDRISEYYKEDGTIQKVEGTQRLLAEDWSHVLRMNWRSLYKIYLDRPKTRYEVRGKMMPSKPIYKEAAQALLDGTYFQDRKWDGQRQDTFFSAYRLIRMMGYTAEEIWNDFTTQIKSFYKVKDHNYWLTRQNCKLILKIDEEVDNG